jgi:hypothetical protein
VAEAKPSRHRVGTHAVARDELVEQLQCELRVDAGRLGGELGLKWLPGDRRALEHPPRRRREMAQLAGERGHHRARDLNRALAPRGARDGTSRARTPTRAQQLLHVEGVAATLEEDLSPPPDVGLACKQRCRLLLAQGAQRHAPGAALAQGRLERVAQGRRRLARAVGERQQHRGVGWLAQQVGDRLDRGGVGPVHIVEREHQRPPGRELLEQRADRPMVPIPLYARTRSDRDAAADRRKHAGELW